MYTIYKLLNEFSISDILENIIEWSLDFLNGQKQFVNWCLIQL